MIKPSSELAVRIEQLQIRRASTGHNLSDDSSTASSSGVTAPDADGSNALSLGALTLRRTSDRAPSEAWNGSGGTNAAERRQTRSRGGSVHDRVTDSNALKPWAGFDRVRIRCTCGSYIEARPLTCQQGCSGHACLCGRLTFCS
jgi:hypothetical protein